MQYCKKCRISIRGNKRCCPLCQGELPGEPTEDAFPELGQKKISRTSALKIISFCFAAVEIAFAALYFLLDLRMLWIPLTMAGFLILWLDVVIGVYYRNNVVRNITVQFYLAMGVCLLADRFTGFHGWSVQWVLPCCFAGLVITTMAVGKGLSYALEEYILYLAVDMILANCQLIFLLTKSNRFVWPAVISLVFVWILAAAALIFRFRVLKRAASKNFHL